MDIDLTCHAQQRLQQRAIPPLIVDLLLREGSCMRHNGADVFFFDKAAMKRARRQLGGDRGLRLIEPWRHSYVVLGNDGQVITAGLRTGRLKRH